MILIIGVRFRKSSKVYYFDPTGYDIKKGDHVIVETARGIEYGTVVLGPKEVTDDKVVSPLKPLTRPAGMPAQRSGRQSRPPPPRSFLSAAQQFDTAPLHPTGSPMPGGWPNKSG